MLVIRFTSGRNFLVIRRISAFRITGFQLWKLKKGVKGMVNKEGTEGEGRDEIKTFRREGGRMIVKFEKERD